MKQSNHLVMDYWKIYKERLLINIFCAQSNMFIGNSFSGFSQMTHYLCKAMHRNITLENIKEHMINNPKDTPDNVSNEMAPDFSTVPNRRIFV
jgi:hypothetical protein